MGGNERISVLSWLHPRRWKIWWRARGRGGCLVAEGDASGNGVINKSVNDVSGLMLVVTRSPAGLGEAVASPDVLSKNFTLSLSLSPSLSKGWIVFDCVARLIRSFPIPTREFCRLLRLFIPCFICEMTSSNLLARKFHLIYLRKNTIFYVIICIFDIYFQINLSLPFHVVKIAVSILSNKFEKPAKQLVSYWNTLKVH